jgi:hypothetical protein
MATIREDHHDTTKLYNPEDEAPPYCDQCGLDHFGPCLEDDEDDEPWEDPVQADAETLASAGWGTDEDYGGWGDD